LQVNFMMTMMDACRPRERLDASR